MVETIRVRPVANSKDTVFSICECKRERGCVRHSSLYYDGVGLLRRSAMLNACEPRPTIVDPNPGKKTRMTPTKSYKSTSIFQRDHKPRTIHFQIMCGRIEVRNLPLLSMLFHSSCRSLRNSGTTAQVQSHTYLSPFACIVYCFHQSGSILHGLFHVLL